MTKCNIKEMPKSYLNHLTELNCTVWTIWITSITAFRNSPENRIVPFKDSVIILIRKKLAEMLELPPNVTIRNLPPIVPIIVFDGCNKSLLLI